MILDWSKSVKPGVVVFGIMVWVGAAQAQQSHCVVGQRVLAEPGDHPATVLAASGASCRLHYDDGAFPDGWDYNFNIKPIDTVVRNESASAAGPRPGRYNFTIGAGLGDGYLVITSTDSYALFLPGGKSAGHGRFAFDRASATIHWISGPLTDPRWDGTQKLESDGKIMKIRLGKRSVASSSG
jgi:hypothetical protein